MIGGHVEENRTTDGVDDVQRIWLMVASVSSYSATLFNGISCSVQPMQRKHLVDRTLNPSAPATTIMCHEPPRPPTSSLRSHLQAAG